MSVTNNLSRLVTQTSRYGRSTTRIERSRDLALAGLSLWQLGSDVFEKAKTRFAPKNYVVSVEEDDELFDRLQLWLLEHLPPTQMRNVLAFTRQRRHFDEWEHTRRVDRALSLVSQNSEPQDLRIGGHRVTVEYKEPELSTGSVGGGDGRGEAGKVAAAVVRGKAQLLFTARDQAGYGAVVQFLRETVSEMNRVARPSRVFVGNTWGGWERLQGGESRPLDTVILRRGVKEAITSDIEHFLGQERKYVDLGIPYHRGYLLHGPPGTGKTSLVRAVAASFHLDLYYVSLADLGKDADISTMLNRMEPGSVLLLEDIDSVEEATVDRDSKAARKARKRLDRAGVTMTGILNSLDGAVTPHGLIVFMSTNHRDRLDPALLRKGRVDVDQLIDCLSVEQLSEMVERFVGEPIEDLPPDLDHLEIPPSEVVEVIKQHLDGKAADAVARIRQLVLDREAEVFARDS